MHSRLNKTLLRCLSLRFALYWMLSGAFLLSAVQPSSAQQSGRGTITGTVTADQGQVVSFRVSAHNLDLRLWYTVFTNKGKYTVPQALPGRYEMMVDMAGYDSPKLPIQLAAGESKTVDVAVKKHEKPDPDAGKWIYVNTMEEIFPPGPGLDLLKENCTGCHADTPGGWGAMRFTKERYLSGVEQMFETGPGFNAYTMALGHTPVNKQQKEMIAEYLAKNFGPGSIEKRLRLDPMPYDEEVTSKAIYVSYDLPVDLPFAPGGPKPLAPMINGYIAQSPPPNPRHHLGNTYISPVDGNIWHSSRGSSSILRLNPKERDPLARWTNYPIIGDPYVHPDGVSVNKQGHVFFAELRTGRLGELRPENGTMIRHALPMQTGALHEAIVDKDGNVGFDFVWGAAFGRMEAKTGKIHLYPTPTPDNGLYGLAFDQQGNMWASGWQKGTINKWDLATESVKEYKVPNSWGQMRRIGVDSKGIVWSTEYITGMVARLDPATGEISEIKIPYSGAKPYDSWPDKEDNIWMGDQAHNAIIKYDQKTKKFSYFPMPQPGQSINKFQMEENNTIWFGSRSVPVVTSVHFYPDGYTAKAPPVP